MFETPELSKNIDYNHVYDPSEDTFLLMDCLEKDYTENLIQKHTGNETKTTVSLEIGSGSGMISSFIYTNKIFGKNNFHISSDVNHLALSETLKTVKLNSKDEKLKRYECLLTSLFAGFRDKVIDYFVFNPPYVPSEKLPEEEDLLNLALEGGIDGMEVTNVVLNSIASKMSPKGIGYILFCAQNKPSKVCEEFNAKFSGKGLVMELVDKRKCGWEVLSVYRFYCKNG